jgi:hypothetical protein
MRANALHGNRKMKQRWNTLGTLPLSERGTSLLELALILPIFLLLLLGIIDIGRYAEFNIVVANAAHAGAQYGAQNVINAADSTGIQNAAMNDAQNTLKSVSSNVLCGCTPTSLGSCPITCGAGVHLTYIQVTAAGTFNPLFGYVSVSSPVSKTAEMRVAE